MKIINRLMARNRSWVQLQKNRDADYFLKMVTAQQPQALWIGCSDSRMPAEVLTCAPPGEIFVHRNIANMVLEDDESLMSVLQYALQHLQITTLIVCGHYGCGGVKAALELKKSQTEELDPLIRRLCKLYRDLDGWMSIFKPEKQIATTDIKTLTQYHILAQTINLIHSAPVKSARQQGKEIAVYGCLYELHSGRLKRLI
ncbi:carbonic anhydrase [Erwinia sp. BNK-24-b]|uniref:carbonic anhydrase n=1 Tax=unclassified Erwinia TaxID=2622719 RepID=UPI0039BED1FF